MRKNTSSGKRGSGGLPTAAEIPTGRRRRSMVRKN
jgi:hypothetical protein